jgi:hypothetical protein
MKTGEIFLWTTGKAKGHNSRDKYHIFICVGDWAEANTFLFISSLNYFADFKIDKIDWPQMPKEESFISPNPVFYTDAELASFTIKRAGYLTKRHISRIVTALHLATK